MRVRILAPFLQLRQRRGAYNVMGKDMVEFSSAQCPGALACRQAARAAKRTRARSRLKENSPHKQRPSHGRRMRYLLGHHASMPGGVTERMPPRVALLPPRLLQPVALDTERYGADALPYVPTTRDRRN